MRQIMNIRGMSFPVVKQIEIKSGGTVPLVDIKMMSDERWQDLAAEKAVKHFREWYGRKPETLQEAFEGQRLYVEKLLAE